MFTGIIESLGTIERIRVSGANQRLVIDSGLSLDQSRIGDSIAVNGACLTAVSINGSRFEADVSPETMASTTFGQAKIGERVNIERAMRLSDRIDGHLVSGHIDGIGTVRTSTKQSNWVVITIGASTELLRYMIPKGSVAIDGISLTINDCSEEGFTVGIIPHTAAKTTIGLRKPGARVNLETDLIGKYVEQFTRRDASGQGKSTGSGGISRELLAKSGYL